LGTRQRCRRLRAGAELRRAVRWPHGQAEPRAEGPFVALCWIAQIYKHIPDPKPSYVADWDDLPQWQQETDADIFERIEQLTASPSEAEPT
jgi:hypothetical protein